MRIGIDARMYGPSFTGIGRYTYELIRNLATLDTGNEYVIFLRKEAFDTFEPPNARFHKVLADFPHYSFAEQFGFLKVLNEAKLDLMHFCHFNAPIFYRNPYIVTIHDLTLSFYPGKKMNNFIRRSAYHIVLKMVTRRAQKIIAVSEHTKKDLQDLYHVSEERISVIYNGVNPEFAAPVPLSRESLMAKFCLRKPYFLYTGVWRDHKNIVGLIKAFADLNREMGKAYHLVITGRPNLTYSEIPDAVKTLKLENEVSLAGQVSEEDLKGLYHYALAYIFPSFYEGFGLPPLEAMQCGVPVAASNRSAIPEICGEGNALFFDPADLLDMKEKMRIIATDNGIRKQLIERGFERVKAFNWGKMADAVLKLYNQLAISSKL